MTCPTETARLPNGTSRAAGFTLLELIVVMGILSGFLVMLVQLVDTGLSLFSEGETGQMLADRGSRAQRTITAEVQMLRGGASGRDRDRVQDRLLVQWLPVGLPANPERGAPRVQMIRAAVQLPPDRELALIDELLAQRVILEEGDIPLAELAKRVAELRAVEPLRGLGNMMLLPWSQEGADASTIELRIGWFLPGQKVEIARERRVDPFEVLVPGSADLPALAVYGNTTQLLGDLLHVEFAFWSQHTTKWDLAGGLTSGGAGPETIWDSTRGGWLTDEATGGVFALDRGPASFGDPADDIHPHAIRVTCVAAQPADLPPEGLLASRIGPDDKTLRLRDGERFAGPDDGGWVKVDAEWIYYAERSGDRLTGLRRGQRHTKAAEHLDGVRAHVGITVEFVIPIHHKKDDWNG